MLHAYVLNCEDRLYDFFLNCEHVYTYMPILLFNLAPRGNPRVPVNPMGMGFLMGGFCICGHGDYAPCHL
jgi:hypothetical protein